MNDGLFQFGLLCFVTGAVECVLEASLKSHLKRRQSGRGRGLGEAEWCCVQVMTRTCAHTLCGNINEKTSKHSFYLGTFSTLTPSRTHSHAR